METLGDHGYTFLVICQCDISKMPGSCGCIDMYNRRRIVTSLIIRANSTFFLRAFMLFQTFCESDACRLVDLIPILLLCFRKLTSVPCFFKRNDVAGSLQVEEVITEYFFCSTVERSMCVAVFTQPVNACFQVHVISLRDIGAKELQNCIEFQSFSVTFVGGTLRQVRFTALV